MKGQLIPGVRTEAAYVVSVNDEGRYRPLAAFASREDAHQIAKLVGMSEPILHPRIDEIWMPADSFQSKRGGNTKQANGDPLKQKWASPAGTAIQVVGGIRPPRKSGSVKP